MNYYATLGVKKDASQEEIKKAYRKSALLNHPDRNPGDEVAEQKFKDASEAFEVLGDPDKRAEYDQFGSVNKGRRSPYSSPFHDMFGSFFRQQRVRKGDNIVLHHNIDLKAVLTGVTVQKKFQRKRFCETCEGKGGDLEKCTQCNGSGHKIIRGPNMTVQTNCEACQGSGEAINTSCDSCNGTGFGDALEDSIEFKIPSGIEDGMSVRMSGEGEPGPDGYGDLFVVVHVDQHELFQRLVEGNLLTKVPVTFSQLVKGGNVEVVSLEEVLSLKVSAGTQSGTKFRLKGKGLPKIQRNGSTYGVGDMIVEVVLEIPQNIDKEYAEAVERMSELETMHVSSNIAKYKKQVERQHGRNKEQ